MIDDKEHGMYGPELEELGRSLKNLSTKRQLAHWRALAHTLAVTSDPLEKHRQITTCIRLVNQEFRNSILKVSNQPEA